MKNLTQQVLEFLQTIPKGKVATYKSIAQRFNTHPRAIATIMRTNKLPEVYPCYKVVSVSWDLLWYSAKEGPKTKKKLLELDGVLIKDGKVDISCMI